MQSFGGPFHSKITWAGTGLIEGCNRRKCFYCLFIEMECILLRFPTYVIGSSLAEYVKIEIRGCHIKIMQTEDLIVREDGPAKLDIEIKSDWLVICFTFVTKSPGTEDWSRLVMQRDKTSSSNVAGRRWKSSIFMLTLSSNDCEAFTSYFARKMFEDV